MDLELEQRHVFIGSGTVPSQLQRGDVLVIGTGQCGDRGANAEFAENVN
jgi:hypothetical protein